MANIDRGEEMEKQLSELLDFRRSLEIQLDDLKSSSKLNFIQKLRIPKIEKQLRNISLMYEELVKEKHRLNATGNFNHKSPRFDAATAKRQTEYNSSGGRRRSRRQRKTRKSKKHSY